MVERPKPPRENGKFVKGFSGNEAGRPKGSGGRAKKSPDLIPVKRNGKTRYEDPDRLVMRKMAVDAANGNVRAGEVYLRELRMRAAAEARIASATRTGKAGIRTPSPYYESALLAMGALKRNRQGHVVLTEKAFGLLIRAFPVRQLSRRRLDELELALEDPRVLTRLIHGHRLKYKDPEQANWARDRSVDDAMAPYQEMLAETEAFRQFKRSRSARRRA